MKLMPNVSSLEPARMVMDIVNRSLPGGADCLTWCLVYVGGGGDS